jgi:hypothetical protein
MKRARAKIDIKLFKTMLKLPFNVELISVSLEPGKDHLDILLEGDALPVKDKQGDGKKGRIPEIIYDPRPTWTVAGMSVKEK